MTVIDSQGVLTQVEAILVPAMQKANADAASAELAAATQHETDTTTIALLRQEILDLQNQIPPSEVNDPFIIGASIGPGAIDVRREGDRKYFNATTVAQALAYAEGQMKNGLVPLISLKPSGTVTSSTWAAVGQGMGDTWIKAIFDGLEALAVKYKLWAYLAIHHEPEQEILGGWSTQAFVAMQMRAASFATTRPHVRFGVIAMGYHQFDKTDVPMSSLVPPQLAVLLDYAGIDPYDETGGKNWPAYFAKFKNWRDNSGNPDLEMGVAETGTTAATFAKKPTWFRDTVKAAVDADLSFWYYWNSRKSSSEPDYRMNAAMADAFESLQDND